MDFEKWVDGYKVRVFPWIDGENYYVNVQYYKPGTSICQPPAIDKTAYLSKTERAENMLLNYLSTLIQYIARLDIPAGGHATITIG